MVIARWVQQAWFDLLYYFQKQMILETANAICKENFV